VPGEVNVSWDNGAEPIITLGIAGWVFCVLVRLVFWVDLLELDLLLLGVY
jgi:hypothetical protein